MKKSREMRKGITLIALVITIIVLLILAGVTVATLTGENGLLSKAQFAKERTAEAEQDEKDKISSYENEINNYSTWERTGATINTTEVVEIESTFTLMDGGLYSATFTYPEGYDKDNTYILSAKVCRKIDNNDEILYERYAAHYTASDKDAIYVRPTGIYWDLKVNDVVFSKAKLLIMKLD